MHETHHEYNRDCWMFFGEDRYKIAPRGGEFSYYSDYDQRHCLDVEGMYGRTFESQVAEYHMTYILGNDQPGYQTMDRIKEASMSMGYKFEIKDFRVKGNEAAVLITNIGVAPIYRDAYVAVGGVKGEYSLRTSCRARRYGFMSRAKVCRLRQFLPSSALTSFRGRR
jgi:hypothetical protein